MSQSGRETGPQAVSSASGHASAASYRAAFALGLLGFGLAVVLGVLASWQSRGALPGVLLDSRGLGDWWYRQADYARAADEYRANLAVQPWDTPSLRKLADSLRQLGDVEGSLEVYRRLGEIRPGDARARNELGLALHREGRYQDALIEFGIALSADPGQVGVWVNEGNAYLALRQLELAERSYRQALSLDPASSDAHNGLGAVYGGQGRVEEAAAMFAEAMRLAPDDPAARRNLELLRRTQARAEASRP